MTDKNNKKNIHNVSVLVANKPGVLVRVAQVFARRGFNIDSLVVSPGYNPKFSRMTITAEGDLYTLEQIIKQTSKLVDVIHCSEHTRLDAIGKELALVKVKCTLKNKPTIMKLVRKYKARIIDQTGRAIIIEQSGRTAELDECEERLKKFGIIEMVRSGRLVMVKGEEPT